MTAYDVIEDIDDDVDDEIVMVCGWHVDAFYFFPVLLTRRSIMLLTIYLWLIVFHIILQHESQAAR